MAKWAEGYITDIEYSFGYFNELNPTRATMGLIANQILPPRIRYACELGFGQGISINFHSAASDVEWWGTDFNPQQAAFAKELSDGSGSHIFDESFQEFCSRDDLPMFDFIALHGIWSWISDTNREILTDFIRRKLALGGVVYLSYNTLPGWASAAPLRELIANFSHGLIASSETLKRIERGIDVTEKFLAAQPLWLKANPLIAERFEKVIKPQARNYLAHEYFNRDWKPMYFSDVANQLAHAKVEFASSANPLDAIDGINLSKEIKAFLAEVKDENLYQQLRDYAVNQQFRKDYWVKGRRRLTASNYRSLWQDQKFILTSPAHEIPMKVTGAAGEAILGSSVYQPLLEVLSKKMITSVAELEGLLGPKGISAPQIKEALLVLVGQGHVSPVQHDFETGNKISKVQLFNKRILERSSSSTEINFLCSPVTGGGIYIPRLHQLFLLAMINGQKDLTQIAHSTWKILAENHEKLSKNGKKLETEHENISEIIDQIKNFMKNRLTLLQALRVSEI